MNASCPADTSTPFASPSWPTPSKTPAAPMQTYSRICARPARTFAVAGRLTCFWASNNLAAGDSAPLRRLPVRLVTLQQPDHLLLEVPDERFRRHLSEFGLTDPPDAGV